jgi:mono/diheme cytochrome c family protein
LAGVVGIVYGATRTLPMGDARRGKELFRARSCVVCHSVDGEGGQTAPDLGMAVERGFSPYHLAGLLWNHAPAMWAAMKAKGISKPGLSEREAADLFAYFFTTRYFGRAGHPGRGQRVFQVKRCGACHGLDSAVREGTRPAAAWQSLADPIALAQQMWNHSVEMRTALQSQSIPYPRLTAQELTDLLAYLRSLPQAQTRQEELSPVSAQEGRSLFASKGCAGCHKANLSLEAQPTRYSMVDFAAAMWNHPLRPANEPALMSYEEMRQLLGYLVSMQFFEERGDQERGRRVYQSKRCGACHDGPSRGAPARAALAGRTTSFDMAAAVWKHIPVLLERGQRQGSSWPRFAGSDMADLSAYLHGLEFKRRPGRGAGADVTSGTDGRAER